MGANLRLRLGKRRKNCNGRTSVPMRILVTGSAGHLGEALMRTLPAAGHDAVGIDIKPSPFTQYVGSIADPEAVKRCMRGRTSSTPTSPAH